MDPIQCHVSQHARCTTMLSEPTSGEWNAQQDVARALLLTRAWGRTNDSQWDWAAGLQQR